MRLAAFRSVCATLVALLFAAISPADAAPNPPGAVVVPLPDAKGVESRACAAGPGEVNTDDGRCICADGFERAIDGACVGERDSAICRPGRNEIKRKNGHCVCRAGFARDGDRCAKIATSCPEAMSLTGGKCVYDDPARQCRDTGWIWTGKRCIEPRYPERACRAAGMLWTGTRCIAQPNAAADCARAGGSWTGARCSIMPKTCPRGYDGLPPNCRLRLPEKPNQCPLGARGKWPNCYPVEDRRCPPGATGFPPSCRMGPKIIPGPFDQKRF